jgi:hypothetical protein
MTEQEWLTCTDPNLMLEVLRDRSADRKLRLFAVACCRRIWDQIAEQSSRQAVTISERYADGRANYEKLEAAFTAADRASSTPLLQGGVSKWFAVDGARLAAHPEMRGLADGTATAAAMAGAWQARDTARLAAYPEMQGLADGAATAEATADSGKDFWKQYASEQAHQCILLRDIFGTPSAP